MENLNFISLDFETATEDRSSICEVGLTIVESGEVVQSLSWLIRPEGNIYSPFNIEIHGINPEMTEDSPEFAEAWKEIEPYLNGQVVIAHNTAFDMYSLKDALDQNGLEYPTFTYYCSYRISKYVMPELYSYSLDALSRSLEIPCGTRHRAGDDAELCAKVFIYAINRSNIESLSELESRFEFRCGKFEPGTHRPQRSTKESARLRNRKPFGYVGDPAQFDESSYFFGKTVCFTGKCMYGTRDQMCQSLANMGGCQLIA